MEQPEPRPRVTVDELITRELLELEEKVIAAGGAADPVAALLATALAGDDLDLRRAAAAAAHVRLGEHPCPRCRRRAGELEVPLTHASHHLTTAADWIAYRALAALERLDVIRADRASLILTAPAVGRSIRAVAGIRWNPTASERLAAALENETLAPPARYTRRPTPRRAPPTTSA
jgi:hypothetical protein